MPPTPTAPIGFGDPWHTPDGPSNLPVVLVEEVDDDAALARRLQQELDDEEMARRLSQSNIDTNAVVDPRQQQGLRSSDALAPPALPIFKGTRVQEIAPNDDEEYARRLQQELQDEILAHQLTVQESQRPRGAPATTPRARMAKRLCTCVTSLVIIAAIVVTLLLVFAGRKGLNLIGINPGFAENDPYYNGTIIPWETTGKGGLKLEVVNALNTKWYTQFQKAVTQWDNGSPDALTLSTSEASPDFDCTHITGKLKVCNGNYGQTQWLGINEQMVQRGRMTASAARMNDFYLDDAAESQRQYTMCHEIGHGFGLPHTDENFYNKDLGNCLDYTSHPWVNQQPAAMNFELLNKTYGTVGTRRDLANDVVVHDQPAWVMPKFSKEVRRLREVGHDHAEELGWTVLHKSPYGQVQTRHLGEDYMAHVRIMFVNPDVL